MARRSVNRIDIDRFRVPAGGKRFRLKDVDPGGKDGIPDRERAELDMAGDVARIDVLQEIMYAQGKHALLCVFQAVDCGGKDGTIRKVAGRFNPAGVSVVSFGPPTDEEKAHDFLWRIRRALPAPGYVGVFNRSHYEDVLVVRVHGLVPPDVWGQRYDQINAFERELTADGLTIVKVMLHISAQEQLDRLRERLDDPTKHWKYNPGDVGERHRWADYQAAYADALARCSTDVAPWYVVPADRKWYRDWAVAHLLRETLLDMHLDYPPPDFDVEAEKARLKTEQGTP
jgi:PPK2 family polyphosphate:nucleotide phosphotransferase